MMSQNQKADTTTEQQNLIYCETFGKPAVMYIEGYNLCVQMCLSYDWFKLQDLHIFTFT